MKKSDKDLKKLIYGDCRKAMMPSTFFYSLEDCITGLLAVYTANVLGEFADAVFRLDLRFGLANVWKLLLCIGITVLIIPAIGLVGEVLMFSNALRHDRLIFGRFFDKTYAEAMRIEEGEVQYRLEKDPNEFRYNWKEIIKKITAIPAALVYLLYSALQISRSFTLIVFGISLIKLMVPTAVKKLNAKYDRETREYNTRVRTYESEIIRNPYVTKIYGLKNAFIDRLDKIYHGYFKSVQVKSIQCKQIADGISSFLDTFCVLIILLIGAVMTADNMITPGAVAAMVGYFSVFNIIIGNIGFVIRNIPILNNIADRMNVLYAGQEDLSGENIEPVSVISAKRLAFFYEEKEVFKDVDFDIQTVTKIAVCGVNGSGKSTLIKLLCGLLKSYKGSLKLNGKEFRDIAVESWRQQIAYVAQEPYLFAGSVKENIQISDLTATEEAIDHVMNEIGMSHLAGREVSMSQNDLSGGEKQKISIARALIKDTPIIILDEPSNNLDSESLIWLNEFIKKSSKTILFISHDNQLSGLANSRITLKKEF